MSFFWSFEIYFHIFHKEQKEFEYVQKWKGKTAHNCVIVLMQSFSKKKFPKLNENYGYIKNSAFVMNCLGKV